MIIHKTVEKEMRNNMKKYEVLPFDLDDTLIENLENVRYAFKKMVEFVGEPYTDAGFDRWYNLDKQFWIDFHDNKIIVPEEYQDTQEHFVQYVRSLRYMMYFNGRINIDTAFEINELFLKSLNEMVVPIDGAYETLEYLHNKYKIVIATNGPTVAVKSKLTKINCLNFINDVFSADMTKQTVTKPKKEYFDELMEYLEYYDREKMLIIGDSLYSEVRGGMNSEIDSCWLNSSNEELPSGYNPTFTISKLKQLKKLL